MLRKVFDNRLIFPPVSRLKVILECGFGAGDWSVDVAEQYPDAEVRIHDLLFQALPLLGERWACIAIIRSKISLEIKHVLVW